MSAKKTQSNGIEKRSAGTTYLYPCAMTGEAIYLDYHATTPVDERVLQAVLPYFRQQFGNAASRSHVFGWKASQAVELAREQVAGLLNADPKQIFFTSGSTEGLNLAIKGMANALVSKGKHIISITTEHPAVLDTLDCLRERGFEIQLLPVLPDGQLDLDLLQRAIRRDTTMVVAMMANNETGVLHPLDEIARICQPSDVMFISDTTQAVGKEIVNVELGLDAAVVSSHKIYGPKGTGALYFSKRALKWKPDALIHGGGHENGMRSGTLNVPGIVGLGKAAALCKEEFITHTEDVRSLRDDFESKVLLQLPEIYVNGNRENRLSTVSNLKVRFVDAQAVMTRFRHKLAISSGSACSSANPEPSHVLLAMGLTPAEAKGSFRFSFGIPTTQDEVDLALQLFIESVETERALNPVWKMHLDGIDVSGLA